MATGPEIFDAHFLRELAALDAALLRLRGQAGEGIARRGRGAGAQDFRGHRPYSPGDDLRRLDWNAYGRLGRFFMREFERERTEHVTLLPDQSQSMRGAKWSLACRVAAAVGYLALQRGGTAAVWGDAPVEGAARFARLLDGLRALAPDGGDLGPRLEEIASRGRAPADLFVLTDGLEPLERFSPLAQLASRGTSATVLVMLDPIEMNPAPVGPVELYGREQGRAISMQVDEALVREYQQELGRHIDGLELQARRHGWTVAVCESSADLRGLFLHKLAGEVP
ncbi:MAG: DUF58 domain-containing protein [Planctomycetes bacterium]|nr:DUF58 domain-containing protein [Planctomycetota bacterium]